jgi:hypothetical protein
LVSSSIFRTKAEGQGPIFANRNRGLTQLCLDLKLFLGEFEIAFAGVVIPGTGY